MTARATVTIVFSDDSTKVVPMRPVALIAAERAYGGDLPKVEGSLYAAWFTLGKPGDNFNAWVETIDAVQETVEADGPAGPLAQEPSPVT